MNQAIFIKNLEGWNGDARLYKLVPPMNHVSYDNVVETHEYVAVSAVTVPWSGSETYIFAADEHGHVENYVELEGSFNGDLDHERALHGAGYEVCGPLLSDETEKQA